MINETSALNVTLQEASSSETASAPFLTAFNSLPTDATFASMEKDPVNSDVRLKILPELMFVLCVEVTNTKELTENASKRTPTASIISSDTATSVPMDSSSTQISSVSLTKQDVSIQMESVQAVWTFSPMIQ